MYGSFINVKVDNNIIPAVRIVDEDGDAITISIHVLNMAMKTWRFTLREFGERPHIEFKEIHSKRDRTITFHVFPNSNVTIDDGYNCILIPLFELEEIYKHC